MLFIKAFTSYFHIYRPPTPSAVASPLRPPSSSDCANGAIHRHAKTAEERFNMLARGWLAYPVTPTHHTSTAEERLYKRHPSVCLVAERRHSSVTRYAKRSVACRDSPRHQTLRTGGTPLPRHRRLPHPIVRHHPSDCPSRRDVSQKKPPKSGFTC